MKKIIKLTESQLERLTEVRINETSAIQIANILKKIPCTGENIKHLISTKLLDFGFDEVNIKFLGYSEGNKILQYIVYTEGPIFTINTISNSKTNPPCMEVVDVVAYIKA